VRNAELLTRACSGYSVAVLRGELATTDAESAADAVAALAADGRQLIIDLGALDFIDCHAAGALLGVRKAAQQAGGDMLLAAPHGRVLRLLTVLDVPGVHASVAAAVDSAGRRDARRLAVPGSRAGNRSWSLRWLRAPTGLRG
jgi:anti-sigma B factor antagonist